MSADALHLESEIRDLTRWALLAEQQVWRAVGNLECKDDKYTEVPDSDAVELAILVVGKLHDMAKGLEASFDRLVDEARLA